MSTRNPFAPPTADLTLSPTDDTPVRKPISVWVMQIIAVLLAAWCSFGLVKLGMLAVAGDVDTRFGVRVLVQLPLQAGFVVMLLLMLWQLPKRSSMGRNIGLGLIALMILILAARILETKANAWPELLGVAIVAFVCLAPLVYWAFAFAFSQKARRYFSASQHA